MASMTFNQKSFPVKPPDKGSFPLDHEGECRDLMLKYMACMQANSNHNMQCRSEAKEYLGCRMDKQLMAKEDWKNLGFSEEDKQ